MPDVASVLRVLDAFRRLDNVAVLGVVSPFKYPGKFHSYDDLVRASGLSRATVYRVLEELFRAGVIDVYRGAVIKFRLKEWEFDCCDVHFEVELNRVVATLLNK